jgi:EAL domain-containing protein (putative c-di-GMP-specific phosphodiesterase class I)
LKEYRIPTENIVIEITEESFNGKLSMLAEILGYYRRIGCKIAIDDFGSNFSNFERIAIVKPDIIKVDMKIVQKSVQIECYDELLKMISSFCQKIGSDVLFEGIENTNQLYNCVKSGGRYFQGFLFSSAQPSFLSEKSMGDTLLQIIKKYKDNEILLSTERNSIGYNLNHIISQYIKEVPLPPEELEFDDYLMRIAQILPSNCIKLFICNDNGWQTSSNIEITEDGTFRIVHRFNNINWSWRSYFLQTLVKMKVVPEGIITTPYRDIVTKEKIHTYSFPLNSSHLLFIDILYL